MKKIFSIMIVVTLMLTMVVNTNAKNDDKDKIKVKENKAIEQKCDQLFEELLHNNVINAREELNSELGILSSSKSINASDANDVILKELESLGVVKLTPEEVVSQFNIEAEISAKDIDISPLSTHGIDWYKSSVYNYTFNGEQYESAILTGVPTGYDSPLMVNDTEIDYITRVPFEIGQKNLINYTINRGVKVLIKEVSNEVPFVGTALKLYDVIKAVISGISTTETIDEIHATETIISGTEIKFVYANKVGNPSDYQNLQFITNRVDASGAWIVPNCTFENGTFTVGQLVGSNEVNVKAEKYGSSSYYAAKYYSSNYQTQRDFVDVDITLLGSITKEVPSVEASFPAQLY